MDHSRLFERSATLNQVVEEHILKMLLGPRFAESKHLGEKRAEYRQGLLDEYNCFLYIPTLPNN